MKLDTSRKIEIVMATFNGAAYLPAQLDSLLAQTYSNWKLLIRDDGSTDTTQALLTDYAQRHPDRIALIADDKGTLGVAGNFSALLAATKESYVMCCDQDDVWLPGKVRSTLLGMLGLEAAYGRQTPLLVHTDAMITDAQLRLVAPSHMRRHKLNPSYSPFARLLVQNTVQGCTMMLNRALVQKLLPIPVGVRMYDMWVAQVAAGLGYIDYLDQATLYYRQHTRNVVGAGASGLAGRVASIRGMMQKNSEQAAVFLARFGSELPAECRAQAEALVTLAKHKPLDRRKLLFKHRLLREPMWHNLAVLLLG